MHRTYTVDHLVYEFSITRNNEVILALTGGASPGYTPKIDPFDWDCQHRVTDDIGTIRFPVAVLRQSWRYLVGWVGNQRPPYFMFAGLTKKRRQLYRRVAKRLVQRFPYYLVEADGTFYFYRLKNH